LPFQDEDAATGPGRTKRKVGFRPLISPCFSASALKAKPKDKFVCFLRIRRFWVKFNGSALLSCWL
jgi:hypothetical protein